MKLQRMAILAEYRHQGLGKILVEEAEVFSKKQGYNTILLGAQATAEAFYEKLGFQAYGEPFEDAGMPHVHMKKEFWPTKYKNHEKNSKHKDMIFALLFFFLLARQLLVTVIPNINIAFGERAITIIDPVNQDLHIFF